jgi:hypothetical protein
MPASAEYYRYVDKDGNVHYTDDLTSVPEDQRTDINEYTGFQSGSNVQEKDEQEEEMPQPLPENQQVKNIPDMDKFSEIKKQLDQKKEKLDEEYRALMEERKDIEKNKNKYRSNRQAKKYNKAILEFNGKIEDYERRKKLFNKEVEEYNERIEKSYSNEIQK